MGVTEDYLTSSVSLPEEQPATDLLQHHPLISWSTGVQPLEVPYLVLHP